MTNNGSWQGNLGGGSVMSGGSVTAEWLQGGGTCNGGTGGAVAQKSGGNGGGLGAQVVGAQSVQASVNRLTGLCMNSQPGFGQLGISTGGAQGFNSELNLMFADSGGAHTRHGSQMQHKGMRGQQLGKCVQEDTEYSEQLRQDQLLSQLAWAQGVPQVHGQHFTQTGNMVSSSGMPSSHIDSLGMIGGAGGKRSRSLMGGSYGGVDQRMLIASTSQHGAGGHPGGAAHQDALMELARENLMLKHQLQVATVEVTRLRQVCEKYIQESEGNGDNSCKINQSRYWTDDEHRRFLEAIQKFGHKDVKAIANFVGGAS